MSVRRNNLGFALQREIAAALSSALGMAPYDALMDGYQRGVTAADVEPVFAAYEVSTPQTHREETLQRDQGENRLLRRLAG